MVTSPAPLCTLTQLSPCEDYATDSQVRKSCNEELHPLLSLEDPIDPLETSGLLQMQEGSVHPWQTSVLIP